MDEVGAGGASSVPSRNSRSYTEGIKQELDSRVADAAMGVFDAVFLGKKGFFSRNEYVEIRGHSYKLLPRGAGGESILVRDTMWGKLRLIRVSPSDAVSVRRTDWSSILDKLPEASCLKEDFSGPAQVQSYSERLLGQEPGQVARGLALFDKFKSIQNRIRSDLSGQPGAKEKALSTLYQFAKRLDQLMAPAIEKSSESLDELLGLSPGATNREKDQAISTVKEVLKDLVGRQSSITHRLLDARVCDTLAGSMVDRSSSPEGLRRSAREEFSDCPEIQKVTSRYLNAAELAIGLIQAPSADSGIDPLITSYSRRWVPGTDSARGFTKGLSRGLILRAQERYQNGVSPDALIAENRQNRERFRTSPDLLKPFIDEQQYLFSLLPPEPSAPELPEDKKELPSSDISFPPPFEPTAPELPVIPDSDLIRLPKQIGENIQVLEAFFQKIHDGDHQQMGDEIDLLISVINDLEQIGESEPSTYEYAEAKISELISFARIGFDSLKSSGNLGLLESALKENDTPKIPIRLRELFNEYI
ncbi:MAG: hypothetical protein MRY21_00005 [Simkaniaceae bacterium]|nr:hypothetical protein [Simkaniaceae bacterium]